MFAFLFRRTRWIVLGWMAKAGMRKLGEKRVDSATDELRERLPDRAVKIADALPGDVLKAGGSAKVASDAARRSVQAGRRAGEMKQNATERLAAARSELSQSINDEERVLRSDLFRITRGASAATDALLDLRPASDADSPDYDEIPSAVDTGRPLLGVEIRPALVSRVSRRYRTRKKAWQDD